MITKQVFENITDKEIQFNSEFINNLDLNGISWVINKQEQILKFQNFWKDNNLNINNLFVFMLKKGIKNSNIYVIESAFSILPSIEEKHLNIYWSSVLDYINVVKNYQYLPLILPVNGKFPFSDFKDFKKNIIDYVLENKLNYTMDLLYFVDKKLFKFKEMIKMVQFENSLVLNVGSKLKLPSYEKRGKQLLETVLLNLNQNKKNIKLLEHLLEKYSQENHSHIYKIINNNVHIKESLQNTNIMINLEHNYLAFKLHNFNGVVKKKKI